jgi:chemotaxis protein CheX
MEVDASGNVLAQIVDSVFTTMMGLKVTLCDASWQPSGDRLTSFVQLNGEWNGAVFLDCTRRQACQFAGRILAMAAPDDVDDNVRDVLGELASMIGGNLKCGIATGVSLSMPTVMEGRNYDMRICGSQVQERIALDCADGNFWVTVLATNE